MAGLNIIDQFVKDLNTRLTKDKAGRYTAKRNRLLVEVEDQEGTLVHDFSVEVLVELGKIPGLVPLDELYPLIMEDVERHDKKCL